MTLQLVTQRTSTLGLDPNADGIPVSEAFGAALTSAGADTGVVAGTGVAVSEGLRLTKRSTFTFTNVAVAIVDHTTNGAQGSLKIYDLPEGLISFSGAVMNLTIARVGTAIAAGAAVVASLGSATAGIGDATLTTTEADYIPSTAATLTAGTGPAKGKATTPALFDGTATAKDVYLNFAIPDADCSGNDTLTVNGTIDFDWRNLGDV